MAQRCREAWRVSSKRQRLELTSLACSATVLYLRLAEQMLAKRTSQREQQEARAAFRLEDLQWSMEQPRLLLVGGSFCSADDAMDFMLGHCLDDLEECLELVRQAKSGRVGVDAATLSLVSGRSATWEQHARDLWTLIIHDVVLHMESAGPNAQCLSNIRAALARPPPSAKRSWPSKKALTEIKASWEQLGVEERIRMTALSLNEYWFVQACDIAMAAVTLTECMKRRLGVDLPVLESARGQSRILASLDINTDPDGRITLSPDFVAHPGCLEELYKKSVWHATEKVELVRKALCCRYEGLFQEDRLFQQDRPTLVADRSTTWADVERVVATLILEGIIQRHSLLRKAAEFLVRQEKLSEQTAEEAAKRKKDKQKRKKQEAKEQHAALMLAEKEREAAEVARQRAEEGRMMAESERTKAEDSRRAQEEARVCAEVERRLHEERRLEQAREEKRVVLALLAKAPSWDISNLRVSRTFLDVEEDPASVMFYKEW